MKILIFGNRYKEGFPKGVYSLISSLKEKGADLRFEKGFGLHINEVMSLDLKVNDLFDEVSGANLALSFGGDGTLLRTASAVGDLEIPILGINCGHLGFLTDVQEEELSQLADVLLGGRYSTEDRVVLKTSTSDGRVLYALNETAVLKQDISSIIKIKTAVNGEELNTYVADGLLVATPTGSTAYSLSVGGPILMPDSHNLIIAPIASHSLNVRPLVIPDSFGIDLQVESRNGNYLMANDGNMSVVDNAINLHIERAGFCVKIVRLDNHSFFKTLRKKLLWGANIIND
ncbi:MAG: NAD kinase [Paludibacteraceae bacterium]|nr:NAD kinase [Paludibacteraceae bacterium]